MNTFLCYDLRHGSATFKVDMIVNLNIKLSQFDELSKLKYVRISTMGALNGLVFPLPRINDVHIVKI